MRWVALYREYVKNGIVYAGTMKYGKDKYLKIMGPKFQ